ITLALKVPRPRVTYFGSRWLEWSPDGNKLAAICSDGTVHVLESATGRKVTVLRGHTSAVIAVAFSSDGTRLAAWGQNGAIRISDVDTGRLAVEVRHPGNVSTGAWSPDNKLLVSGHHDGTVTISAPEAGATVATVKAHADLIYHLAWSPDGTRFASTSANDFFVSIWNAVSKKLVLGPLRHSHGITAIAWEPGGQRLATGSMDETVKIWNTTTGSEDVTLRGNRIAITSLAWGPGARLASGGDFGMRVWNSVRDQESNVLPSQGMRATAVAWSPDGKRLASGSDDGQVRIWDPASRTVVRTLQAHDRRRILPQFGLIRSLAWSPDGTHLATAGLDGAARVWEVATGQEVFALPADHGSVWSVAWSPDGSRLAAGSQDGTIRIVEGLHQTPRLTVIKAHELRRLGSGGEHGVRTLAWSPHGDRLASGGTDGLVKFWDPVRGTELGRMPGQQAWILSVSWSPDGKRIACATSNRLVISWEVATDQKPLIMRGHNDFVDALVWSPDGTRLASAGIDNSVRVWDPLTGEEAFVLRGSSGMFHDVSWSTDGAQLAAASNDGQIWIWDATRGFERDTTARAWPFIERKIVSGSALGEDRLAFAQTAYDHKKFNFAARLWSEVLESDSKLGDDRQSQLRFIAARAAVRAAAGHSQGEPSLDDAARVKLCRQALAWLKAELSAWGNLYSSASPHDQESLLIQLSGWKHDAGLAALRDPAVLARLPVDEQQAVHRLWTDVAKLLKSGNARQVAILHEKLSESRKSLPKDSPELAYLLAQLGRALLELEQWTDAERVLVECLTIREKVLPDSWLTFNTLSSLGGALLGQQKYAEAEPLLLRGHQGMKERQETIPPVGMSRLPEAVARLVQLYEATNKSAEAVMWRAELLSQ
ncbi:MAG TPA: tetratricopeptide repeat protein, partial [Gemmataceae bacterium]|nr:tetratricopeptide repeat protein [Gemmataceae bacterium]